MTTTWTARTRTTVRPLAALAVLVAACGGPTVERSIPRSQVGTDMARLGEYMGFADRVEDVPADVRHDAVRDEATLTRSAAGLTCVAVVERTAQEYDEPLDQLRPRCVIDDGDKVDGVVSGETVTTAEYAFTASVETVHAEAWNAYANDGQGRNFTFSMAHPEQQVFRVVERRGQVCCPGAGSHVALLLRSSRLEYNHAAFTERFVWNVRY